MPRAQAKRRRFAFHDQRNWMHNSGVTRAAKLAGRLKRLICAIACTISLAVLPGIAISQKKPDAQKLPPQIIDTLKQNRAAKEVTLDEPGPWVEKFDLNGDGRNEYLVRDLCSPTGNCAFWILELRKAGVRELLATDMANFTCARITKSHGYRDFEIGSHGSAFESDVRVFRFNGERYDEAASYSLRFEYDEKTKRLRQIRGPKPAAKCYEVFRRRIPPINLNDQ